MKQIEINGQQYLAVEVPEGAKNFILEPTGRDNILSLLWTVNKYWHHDHLPAGNYEIVGLCKDLSWDERCELRGLKNTYYDQTVIGRDMVEFDITHYNVEFDDWLQFKRMHNLSNNTLILKIITNE